MAGFELKSLLEPQDAERTRGPRSVEVGWLINTDKAGFIWDPPRRVMRDDPPPNHAKSVNYCPAVLEHEARLFEVTCPIDATLGFGFAENGEPQLRNLAGDQSAIRSKHLGQMVTVVARREWRHPERPVLQIPAPYIFIADEPVWMTQMPPILHYKGERWPGVLIGGRMPIHLWPRQLMWAFEWFDISKPLVLTRGEPWFYARFETEDPTRPIRLVEAEMTPDLAEHIKGLTSVTNYVNRTFALFKTAEARRPKQLLVRKTRK
jgi:hypothetical protein